ncbi:unnamed protein product [Adineta steineri]|uniref:Major facilitator superfamily (MFS) profile domain-containing protein n=1 Tax=Adineta steineri TaxID=433720 RepID=A0A815EQD1_9BILA|nr:unnamed protein product [Adineta steineri]
MGARHFADALRHNTTLTTISLECNDIEDDAAQYLADALQHNTTLTTLKLGSNGIGEVTAQHLADALRHNTTLTTLSLYNERIGNVGAQHLADALRHNTSLTTLNVGGNEIGDVGTQHLADALWHNSTLTTINLASNEIKAVGAQYLADALRHNSTLTTLELYRNEIGAAGARYLGDALQHNSIIMAKSKELDATNETSQIKAPLVCSHRLLLALLAFLGFFLCYAQRNGFAYPGQVLNWPKKTRGLLLGSFYWGYALTQIASSIAVTYFGPKRFLAMLIFMSSLATLLLPVISTWSSPFIILLRVVAGAAQGGLWPTIFRFWSTWAPASERTTLLSFQSAGPSMGTIVSLIIGGLFCTFSLYDAVPFIFRHGWAHYFYLLGGLGIVWSVVWLIFASDTPA